MFVLPAVGRRASWSRAWLDRPWPGAGWAIVPRPSSPSRDFPREPGRSFATCSSPANRWRTPRPGPTKTAARSPAAPPGISSTCRSRRLITIPATAGRKGASSPRSPNSGRSCSIPTPLSPGAGWRFASSSIWSRTSTSRCTSRTETTAAATTSSSDTDATTTPTCTRSGIPDLLSQGYRNEGDARPQAGGPGQPARVAPLAQGANRRLGRSKAWKLGRRAYLVPGSNDIAPHRRLDRPRLRTGQPAAGRRTARSFRSPARFPAQ